MNGPRAMLLPLVAALLLAGCQGGPAPEPPATIALTVDPIQEGGAFLDLNATDLQGPLAPLARGIARTLEGERATNLTDEEAEALQKELRARWLSEHTSLPRAGYAVRFEDAHYRVGFLRLA